MKIEYTYAEPKDRPIQEAKFKINEYQAVIKLGSVGLPIIYIGGVGGTLNQADFADFTALVNRINRQIGND